MLKVFKENAKVGTVGARLHFGDNTVQHDGVFMLYNKKLQKIDVGHLNIKNYYNHSISVGNNLGNTGGLLMIRKNVFNLVGMFNENYISCFEDVELNLECSLRGYQNFTESSCVSYHYESLTRNEDSENLKKLQFDFLQNLLPFVKKDWEKIKNKIFYTS
jgi:GT2 family glycosyltransferase